MDNPSVGSRYLPGIRGAIVFYLLTFALSWLIWGTLILFPQTAAWAPLLILFGAYGPLLASLLLARIAGGRGAIREWLRVVFAVRGRWQWIILGALGLPLLIALIHLLVHLLFVGPITLSADPPWYWAAAAVPVNIFVLAWMSSAVEEFGWQGFAMPRLVEQMHPLAASLVHGLLWGTWHLPLYLTKAWSADYQPVWLLYGITITLAPTMFWLTQKSGGSVVAAVLFHAATNYYSSTFVENQQFPIFSEPLTAYFAEIKLIIYLAIAVVLIAATRGRLGQ
jgi:membrane protease YdiL (CAAX protease family)